MGKKVLITGASGGFGKLTVEALLNNSFTVVASMRNSTTKNKDVAEHLSNLGAKIVEIDVTNDSSVENGVRQAIEIMNGLDVVVNNAGVGSIGMMEHFTVDDFKNLYDINVFGVQRVNRAALPYMREQKSGLIIYISSLLGRMTMPFYGLYNSTKWALEALAENYRVELSGFGIENCIIEPGGYPTSFMESLMSSSDRSRDASYGDFMNMPSQMFSGFEHALKNNPSQDPNNVALAILNAINTNKGERKFRIPVDSMGMGSALEGYNDQLEGIMKGIYGNFGMQSMLE